MAIKCPDCGFSNEDTKLFCGACGEPLGGDARLVRDMERLKEKKAKEAEEAKNAPAHANVPLQGVKKPEEEFVHKSLAKKKDNTDTWLILLGLTAFFIICVCGFYVMANWDAMF